MTQACCTVLHYIVVNTFLPFIQYPESNDYFLHNWVLIVQFLGLAKSLIKINHSRTLKLGRRIETMTNQNEIVYTNPLFSFIWANLDQFHSHLF